VAAEARDPDSLLSHYRTLISLRNSHSALRTGKLFLPSTSNQGLFACLLTTADESVLVLVNLTGSPIREYELSLPSSSLSQGKYMPALLLGVTRLAALTVADDGRISSYVPVPEVPPYATIMMQLKSE
jgi:hypothetical protein